MRFDLHKLKGTIHLTITACVYNCIYIIDTSQYCSFVIGGAWLVAYKEEQKKRFNAVLCPLTQEESEISKKTSKVQKLQSVTKSDEKVKILDGMYLV